MASSDTGVRNRWTSGSLWGMTGRVQVVTLIGAGGKTTCLRSLTREINSFGNQVIATTTTKVFPEESLKGWKNLNPPPYKQAGACFWYVDVIAESGKWLGPPLKAVDAAIASARSVPNVGIHGSVQASAKVSQKDVPNLYWVIEGDGARGLKLKCWEAHEPQVPQRSDCVVLVLDGGLWGRVLQAEHVHRPAGCLELIGQVWNAEQAWCYFLSSPVFNPQYGQMSWVILLNTRASKDSDSSLSDLDHKWTEIQREVKDMKYRPKHLRIATGDAKEGTLQWFDLW